MTVGTSANPGDGKMADAPVSNGRWPRIKTLFSRLVEQPPEAVGAWIDAHCGDDASLRRELESLLASHQSIAGFMEAPAIAAPGAAGAIADRLALDLHAAMMDRHIGPYRLVSELGRGGMGVVYLAERDDQAFDRQVAIKMVHGGSLHPSLVDRFEAERRILARFEHPNIARLLDAGTDESGTPYAVMEYVQGTPIDAYVVEGRLPVAKRLELFCLVCDAVQYSHARLVVHRDIKPGNVLVTEDGVPKLLDFGIAKLLDPSGEGTDRTRTDLRALTPESASPEQLRGDPITVVSDVYSLGVLLFRLLTGASPYGSAVRTEVEMARAICEEEVIRPSEAVAQRSPALSPREIAARRRELKGDLDLITLKALRKEPHRRYASVEHFARDIRRHLAGEAVEAVPDSRRYRAAKFLRRHRASLAVTAAIGVTMTAGLVATLVQARVARVERARAEQRFDEVRGLARSMIFEVYDAIRVLPGSTAARELLLRRALGYLDRLASEPGADATLQREVATAYARIGSVQGQSGTANLGQQAAAIASYRKAFSIFERLATAAPTDRQAQADLAAVQRDLGTLFTSVGDAQKALDCIRASVSLYERLLLAGQPSDASLHGELALSYLAWADIVIAFGDVQQASSLAQKALPLSRRAAEAAPSEAGPQRALASTYRRVGAFAAAAKDAARGLEAYRNALAIDERRLAVEPNSPEARMDVSTDVGGIGATLLLLGNLREALAACERARRSREDLLRADSSDARARTLLAQSINHVALVRWGLGEREQALAEHRLALQHLDILWAIKPADPFLRHERALVLAQLGVRFAQVDARRPGREACRRARPFLVRALVEYRDLVAHDALSVHAQPTPAELEAAFARCDAGR